MLAIQEHLGAADELDVSLNDWRHRHNAIAGQLVQVRREESRDR